MFVNFSNHPSDRWEDKQLREAMQYGHVIDIQFPEVPALANEEDIGKMASKCVDTIKKHLSGNDAVMVQGEFTLTYSVVNVLREEGIKVVSACSERNVVEETDEDGSIIRKTRFDFKRFREYR